MMPCAQHPDHTELGCFDCESAFNARRRLVNVQTTGVVQFKGVALEPITQGACVVIDVDTATGRAMVRAGSTTK